MLPRLVRRFSRSGAERGRGRGGFFGGAPVALSARFHFADDGTIGVFSGKVDGGQGARCELAQAAAEELRVPLSVIRMTLGDTGTCPNDGTTAGSGTTPRTVPAVRQAAAAVRQLLVESTAKKWQVEPNDVEVHDGKLVHAASKRSTSYVEAAKDEELAKELAKPAASGAKVTPVPQWKTLGTEQKAPAARDKVTGRHAYPSDLQRPGMLYGRVLRSPKYRAKLLSVDMSAGQGDGWRRACAGWRVCRGRRTDCVCRTSKRSKPMAKTAKWVGCEVAVDARSFTIIFASNVAGRRAGQSVCGAKCAKAAKSLQATYTIAYVQHAPLEPRVALAEWIDGKLTVWTATQNPFGVRGELMSAFRLAEDKVRVIVPDFGSGYGGKHTGECAVEAARLAQAAKKPVMLRWTREEEFTWAYFRPAAVIDVEASLDDRGRLVDLASREYQRRPQLGRLAVRCAAQAIGIRSNRVRRCGTVRIGRLAATGNTFARESFMDEMAAAAGTDPLEFRLAHLTDPRLRAVLEEAARRFKWTERVKQKQPNRGVGLACGTEKGSFVACCAEVEVDRAKNDIRVRDVCQTFDCGPVLNPENLRNQMEGAIIMGLGPALREEIRIEDDIVANASFRQYRVPRFADVPTIEVHAMNRTDVEPAGAGETPIIGIAPAIGNAVFQATGVRLRAMPMKLMAEGVTSTSMKCSEPAAQQVCRTLARDGSIHLRLTSRHAATLVRRNVSAVRRTSAWYFCRASM